MRSKYGRSFSFFADKLLFNGLVLTDVTAMNHMAQYRMVDYTCDAGHSAKENYRSSTPSLEDVLIPGDYSC